MINENNNQEFELLGDDQLNARRDALEAFEGFLSLLKDGVIRPSQHGEGQYELTDSGLAAWDTEFVMSIEDVEFLVKCAGYQLIT